MAKPLLFERKALRVLIVLSLNTTVMLFKDIVQLSTFFTFSLISKRTVTLYEDIFHIFTFFQDYTTIQGHFSLFSREAVTLFGP